MVTLTVFHELTKEARLLACQQKVPAPSKVNGVVMVDVGVQARPAVAVGEAPSVGVGVSVRVGVPEMLGLGVRVRVTVGVLEAPTIWVGVRVNVFVMVAEMTGVNVLVSVLVMVGVLVGVFVTRGVFVMVGVLVTVDVAPPELVRSADKAGYHLSEIFWLPRSFGWTPSTVSVAGLNPVH